LREQGNTVIDSRFAPARHVNGRRKIKAAPSRGVRRTQADRTAVTRQALIEAAIETINDSGYNGATTAVIAARAGVSRGAILYQFNTRAQLMAEVIASVYENEHARYAELQLQGLDGSAMENWPAMLWSILSRPSGMAVIEILLASRSDPELAALVKPTQERIELMSMRSMLENFGWTDETEMLAAVRLFVWAIRGLSIAQLFARDSSEIDRSVDFFRRMVSIAFPRSERI
jgi:AcrR family transcriptional regulator